MTHRAVWIARRSAIFLLSFALLSCASAPQEIEGTIENLIPAEKITTPEQAKRALIIAQEVRFSSMNMIVELHQSGKITQEHIEHFRKIDNVFRPTWELALGAARTWELTGDRKQAFDELYKEVLRKVVEMHTFGRQANAIR
jgi:hypothetical protein